MISALDRAVSSETVLVMDTSALVTQRGDEICNYLYKGFAGLEDLPVETLRPEVCHTLGINSWLSNSKRVVITREVRAETRSFLHRLKGNLNHTLKSHAIQKGRRNGKDSDILDKMTSVENYHGTVRSMHEYSFDRDPRDKNFHYGSNFFVDASSPEYVDFFNNMMGYSLSLHTTKNTPHRRDNSRVMFASQTDAHMVTTSYFLQKKGHDVCIVSRDRDFESLASLTHAKVDCAYLDGTSGAAQLFFNPKFVLTVFNPDVLRK